VTVVSSTDVFPLSLDHFLGPLRDLLADASVSEVMVNGHDRVYVERGGRLHAVPNRFASEEDLLACARNIAQYSGKRIDEQVPRFDGRLPDGSRVHVVLPPCSRGGITMAIRKFSRSALTLDRLVEFGSIDRRTRELLEICVALDKNVLVSGGTGSGKTQLLNALSGAIPAGGRILVIEDTSELRLQQEHVVSLEARSADRHGRGEVTIRHLFHSALRLRPDRVLVGECRGGEALDMIQAMNSGHAGSMTTVHANSPIDALVRVETLALMSSVELPLLALRSQVASALQVVVQTDRLADGSRKVTSVAEVHPLDAAGRYQVRELIGFAHLGRDLHGKVLGEHRPGPDAPGFWPEVQAKGFADRVVHLRDAWPARSEGPPPAPLPQVR
jgi:pilus assembly protein CpaF